MSNSLMRRVIGTCVSTGRHLFDFNTSRLSEVMMSIQVGNLVGFSEKRDVLCYVSRGGSLLVAPIFSENGITDYCYWGICQRLMSSSTSMDLICSDEIDITVTASQALSLYRDRTEFISLRQSIIDANALKIRRLRASGF